MTTILHRIKAVLLSNPLSEEPDGYYAKVISERSLDIEAISRTAVSRGRAATTVESMVNHVELFLKEMEHQLKDGYAINTGYFTAIPQIRGVFRRKDAKYDPQEHTIYFRFGQGDILRKGLSGIEVEITGVGDAEILISQITDMKTKSLNGRITPGHNLKIQGSRLKLAGDDTQVGVCFINEDTGERFKVDETDVIINVPSELMILIPGLQPGNYRVEIVSQFTGHKLLKEPRSSVSGCVLTVG